MEPLSLQLDQARPVLVAQLDDFVRECDAMAEIDLLLPSRCRGWSRLELVEHVRLGLDEMSATAAVPSDRAPDHDAASYWDTHPDDRDDDVVPHIMWLRRTASAYARPSGALTRLHDAVDRARRIAAGAGDDVVLFQGKSMTMGDFLGTWITEVAVHQLDLATDDGAGTGLPFARRTLEAIAGAPLPSALTDREAVLSGLGRVPGETALPEAYPVSL